MPQSGTNRTQIMPELWTFKLNERSKFKSTEDGYISKGSGVCTWHQWHGIDKQICYGYIFKICHSWSNMVDETPQYMSAFYSNVKGVLYSCTSNSKSSLAKSSLFLPFPVSNFLSLFSFSFSMYLVVVMWNYYHGRSHSH